MKQQRFSIRKRLKSFTYAFNGLRILFKEEHNARIHFIAAIGVIAFGFYFEIKNLEWLAILFSIGFVITMEIINTALENLADFVSPEKHEQIKKVKDLAAAAVFVSAVVALIVGLMVFIPYINKSGVGY